MVMHVPPSIDRPARLAPSAEREVLRLLEEVLAQPRDARNAWLERKLSERRAIGNRVRYLLAIAEQYRL
ncbi:MAG: hypothetical protein ACTS1X_00180 [Parasphingopyxis sp.]|uniref:hypothetical protein n=1 Tax=Parasphingopyxis sp. TaxID=1920299 RepID=UPI003F9F57B5